MSLLSYNQLIELGKSGIISPFDPELVNSASIDIRLGNKILSERAIPGVAVSGQPIEETLRRVRLDKKDKLVMAEFDMTRDGSYILYPGEFILAQSLEVFNLPEHISAEYKLKSSMARIGLEHLNAGWCDAGWNGSVLTLELKNMTRNHEIVLSPGDKIGQIVFFAHEPVPYDKSYATRGTYNGDTTVSGVKVK